MYTYIYFYIQSNIVCIIISLILVFREINNIDKQLRNLEFLKLIIVYIVFYIIDILWILVDQEFLYNNYLLKNILNFIKLSFFTLGSYQWYIYSEISQGNSDIYITKNRVKWSIPILIIILSIFAYTIYASCLPDKNNDNYVRNVHFFMMITAIFYEITSSIKSLIRAIRNKKHISRKLFISMGINPLIFCIFIFLQFNFIHIPIFCFLNTIWMICFYLRIIDNIISIDPLTKLNNRNQLNSYYYQLTNDNKHENYLLVIDIDHFKNINDIYGHIEGDKALVYTAETFKEVCKTYPHKIFISRFGGDEFVIIAQALLRKEIDQLKSQLNLKLKIKSEENKLPYTICISTGYVQIIDKSEKIAKYIEQADKEMYLEKKYKSLGTT